MDNVPIFFLYGACILLGAYLGTVWKRNHRVIVYLPIKKKQADAIFKSMETPDIADRFTALEGTESFYDFDIFENKATPREWSYAHMVIRDYLYQKSHPFSIYNSKPALKYPYPFTGIVGRPVDNTFTCDWYYDTDLTADDYLVLVLSIPKNRCAILSGEEMKDIDRPSGYAYGYWKEHIFKNRKYPILSNPNDKYYACFTYLYTNDVIAFHDPEIKRYCIRHPEKDMSGL